MFVEPYRFREIGLLPSFVDGHLAGLAYKGALGVDFVIGTPHRAPARTIVEAGIRELLARADA